MMLLKRERCEKCYRRVSVLAKFCPACGNHMADRYRVVRNGIQVIALFAAAGLVGYLLHFFLK